MNQRKIVGTNIGNKRIKICRIVIGIAKFLTSFFPLHGSEILACIIILAYIPVKLS